MKKIIFVICLISVFLIIVINARTPFFLPSDGGWSIGFNYYDSIDSEIQPKKDNVFSIEKLTKINDSTIFLADPFFLKEKDTIYIFLEHKKKNKSGADIAVMKSTNGIDFKYDRVVLDEEFHLSYPQVFKHKGSYYMLPETKRANNILLYKAFNFPYDWRICDTLIKDVRLADPSIYLSDSLNFIVANDENKNLYMYKSNSLFGEWNIHENNPVVRIGSEARAAGRIFVNENKKIILPLQNCTKGYGSGVSLYELDFDKNGNYDIRLKDKFFLKAHANISEFAGGMHHIDIQKINEKYYFVYDGNCLINDRKKFNWKRPLKLTYLDTKLFFYQLFNFY